ncbi:MAG: hypothetical protein RLZZ618_3322 [Pseudomonadota bacterium]|jgi:adenylyl-sulfate kinase
MSLTHSLAFSHLQPGLQALSQPPLLHGTPPRQQQRPCVLWFTGLSGAGKSTIANRVKQQLDKQGLASTLLDGDELRTGLCSGLGFSESDRIENIRRVAHVARLMVQARLIVLVTLVSPLSAARAHARSLLPDGEFFEVFVDAPLATVQRRDTKGLYARARGGESIQLTGVQAPYERPTAPELRIDSSRGTVDDACEQVLTMLHAEDVLRAPPTWLL